LALAGAGVRGAAAENADEVRRAIEAVYAEGDYQRDLPPRTTELLVRSLLDFDIPPIVLEVIKFVVYALIAVGIGLLILHIVKNAPAIRRRLTRAGRQSATRIPVSGPFLDRSPAMDALAEADELAAEGAFGEALHRLLIHCLEVLKRQTRAVIAPSLTGREIVGQAVLAEAVRRPLESIVAASELGHFGGRPVDEATYRRCRTSFEQLAAAGGVGPA
jgi:hypothetical protein